MGSKARFDPGIFGSTSNHRSHRSISVVSGFGVDASARFLSSFYCVELCGKSTAHQGADITRSSQSVVPVSERFPWRTPGCLPEPSHIPSAGLVLASAMRNALTEEACRTGFVRGVLGYARLLIAPNPHAHRAAAAVRRRPASTAAARGSHATRCCSAALAFLSEPGRYL